MAERNGMYCYIPNDGFSIMRNSVHSGDNLRGSKDARIVVINPYPVFNPYPVYSLYIALVCRRLVCPFVAHIEKVRL